MTKKNCFYSEIFHHLLPKNNGPSLLEKRDLKHQDGRHEDDVVPEVHFLVQPFAARKKLVCNGRLHVDNAIFTVFASCGQRHFPCQTFSFCTSAYQVFVKESYRIIFPVFSVNKPSQSAEMLVSLQSKCSILYSRWPESNSVIGIILCVKSFLFIFPKTYG